MFGIGTTELILILVIVLILFGPNKLPELARGLGRMIHELRNSVSGLKKNFDEEQRPQEPEKKSVRKS